MKREIMLSFMLLKYKEVKALERILKIVIVLMFAVFYLPTSYWNGFTPDDYNFMANLHKQGGVLQATLYEYQAWSTRWTSVFLNEWFLSWDWEYMPLFRNLISFGIVWFGVSLLIKSFSIQLKNLLLDTCLMSIVFFFAIQDIAASWFWHCAVFTYTWPMAFLMIMYYLTNQSFSIVKSIVLVSAGLFVGGASAPIALVAILFFLWRLWRDKGSVNLWIGSLSIMIGFIVLILGPGNEVRSGFLPETSLMEAVWINTKSLIKYGLFEFPTKLPFWILGALLLNSVVGEILTFQNRRQFIQITVALLGFMFLYHLPIAYAMGEIGPMRTFSLPSVLIQVYIAACLSSVFQFKKSKALGVYAIFMVLFTFYLLPTHYNYGKALQAREINYQKNDQEIILKKLPNPGFYYCAEISDDSTHFTQKHVRRVFGNKILKFE